MRHLLVTCLVLLSACVREDPSLRPIRPEEVPVGTILNGDTLLHMSDETLRSMQSQLDVCMKPGQRFSSNPNPRQVHLLLRFALNGDMADVGLQQRDHERYRKDVAFRKLADKIIAVLEDCDLKNLPERYYSVWGTMQVTYKESVAPPTL